MIRAGKHQMGEKVGSMDKLQNLPSGMCHDLDHILERDVSRPAAGPKVPYENPPNRNAASLSSESAGYSQDLVVRALGLCADPTFLQWHGANFDSIQPQPEPVIIPLARSDQPASALTLAEARLKFKLEPNTIPTPVIERALRSNSHAVSHAKFG
ncbi:hypothetical protein BC827DRAFT_1154548 [Russula dissimulans]|nr:hypothetical protein BC827DRAFT_1154548 [Russula dissimulans]